MLSCFSVPAVSATLEYCLCCTTVGDPQGEFRIGPIANKAQYEKILRMIEIGIEEGAKLVAGGVEKPEGYEKGYYVKPTVFADVTNDMTIAKEEIFGPVLSIIKYDNEDEAIEIANDTEYGLAGYVQGEPEHAKEVAPPMVPWPQHEVEC